MMVALARGRMHFARRVVGRCRGCSRACGCGVATALQVAVSERGS